VRCHPDGKITKKEGQGKKSREQIRPNEPAKDLSEKWAVSGTYV